VENLGGELQRRAIFRHAQWGAQGIVQHLTDLIGAQAHHSDNRSVLSQSVAVQTEVTAMDSATQSQVFSSKMVDVHEARETMLTATDLASILKWSKDISSDINLSSGEFPLTLVLTYV
jgi:hypothetical protein